MRVPTLSFLQTGYIGYLRGDLGKSDEGILFSSWDDLRTDLKTQAFEDDFDWLINELRSDGNFLSSRAALAEFCRIHTDASFGNDREYGVRVDTDEYAYIMRLNHHQGEYSIYCYCYLKDRLDSHLEKAKGGIRFIDSGYKELFRIPDGEQILVTRSDGERLVYTCRYIDDYHLEVGDNLLHICEFAEFMEQRGNTYAPANLL